MTEETMIKAVTERANEMLKSQKINAIYQSFDTKDNAETWLIKSALATLFISKNEIKTKQNG